MARKPFRSKTRATLRMNNSAEAVTQRPKLAAEIGIIIAGWAEVEQRLGLMFADMLGADADLGLAIYYAIRTEGPQRDAIIAAAKQKLTPELADKVGKFVKGLRDRARSRNEIAHGAWGVTDEFPDALVWADQKDSVRYWSWHGSGMYGDLDLWVYDHPDLAEISSRQQALLEELKKLAREVAAPPF